MLESKESDALVVVALGSSLAGSWRSSEALLEAALQTIVSAGSRLVSRSGWWRSKAWPEQRDPEFLNGVALFKMDRTPREWLSILQASEREFGRTVGARNAPRTLDLDLVAFGRTVTNEPGLIIPHPRAHERRFVMGPLAEAAPDWRHPTLGETANALAAKATIGLDARPAGHAALHKKP